MNQFSAQSACNLTIAEVDSFEHATALLMFDLIDIPRDERAGVMREWFLTPSEVVWKGCEGDWRVYRYLPDVEPAPEPE